jgi:transcriptional regulator with XRE-family HTH domain
MSSVNINIIIDAVDKPRASQRDEALRQSIANQLRKYKNERTLKDRELADTLGISVPTLQKYLSGSVPEGEILARILALGIPIEYRGVVIGVQPPQTVPQQLPLAYEVSIEEEGADKETSFSVQRKTAKPVDISVRFRLAG